MAYPIIYSTTTAAPWNQRQIDMKNQLMSGLLSSMGYSGAPKYSNVDGRLYNNSTGEKEGLAVPQGRLAYLNSGSTETSGSVANSGNTSTDWGSNMYNTGAQRLTDTYNNAVQSNINDANRRGLFGSSVAAQASQDTAKAYGQGLSELASNIGAQEAQYGLTQQQINNQRLNTLLGLFD